jgi:hypothetical protein
VHMTAEGIGGAKDATTEVTNSLPLEQLDADSWQ